ncbi:MAG TPA: dUTP diphosphatase [Methanosarcinales archaeon]|nr:dUTP diphosphatase [Methanosarcinales archaeon]
MHQQKCATGVEADIKLPEGRDLLCLLMQKQTAFLRRFINLEDAEKDMVNGIGLLPAQHLMDMVTAMQQECAELNDLLPWKHWKDYSSYNFHYQIEEAKYEAVDILCFLMNCFVLMGMSPEDVTRYCLTKQAENIKRQEDGYAHQQRFAEEVSDANAGTDQREASSEV